MVTEPMEQNTVEQNTGKARILVVQDDATEASSLGECLRGLGYTPCATVPPAWDAVEKAADARPDLTLVDVRSDGPCNGVELGQRIEARFDIPVVCLVDRQGGTFSAALESPLSGHVLKPIDPRQLHLNVQTALALHRGAGGDPGLTGAAEREMDELQARADLMEAVFDSMREGVIVIDEHGKFLFANSRAREIAGGRSSGSPYIHDWSHEFGIYFSDKKTLLPLDRDPLMRALRGEETDRLEIFVANLPGRPGFSATVSARSLKTGNQRRGGAVAVFQDITQMKEAEDRLRDTMLELRQQSELMETTFNSIRDAILVVDREGKYLYANPAARELFRDEIEADRSGEWLQEVSHPYLYPDRQTPIEIEDFPVARAIIKGQAVEDSRWFRRDPKSPHGGRHMRVNARPFFDESGGIRGAVATYHDVTIQVLSEEALTQAFTQGRLEIVDTILHNIGNAINSVTTGIETVHQHMSDDDPLRRLRVLADAVLKHRDDWVDYIRNDPQGQKVLPFLVALADDFARQHGALAKTVGRVRDRARHIADIVRTQKGFGGANMVRKDIDLGNALLAAVKVLDDVLDRRKIQVDIDCGKAPREIRIQESQFHQSFHQSMVNIIKNAAEAIDELAASGGLDGMPRIRIRTHVEGEFLNIEVSDNGIGVADGDARAFFAAGYSNKESGTGLGLHSAANFVIGSGGEIDLVSDGPGKGATTRVRLRLSSVTPPPLGHGEPG